MNKHFFLTFFTILLISSLSIVFVSAEISGFENVVPKEVSFLTRQDAALNPVKGTAKVGYEVKIELVAYPFLNAISDREVKLPHYQFEVNYDPIYFDHVLTTNLVEGLDVELNEGGFGVINFRAAKQVVAWFHNEPTTFAEITLLPKTVTDETEVIIKEFVVPQTFTFESEGKMLPMLTKFESGKYNIIEDPNANTGGGCRGTCKDRECGTDGCGIVCGTCEDSQVCSRSGQCSCVPDCTGRACGSDGCGGSCGTCDAGIECDVVGTNSYCGTPSIVEKKIEPIKKQPLNYYYFVGFILIIIAIAIIVYMYYRKKKEDAIGLIQ